ncbi:MAG: TonB-dependent receptor [Rudaea sp.]|uniref:TonB-dependent receptor n=1 Tax=Rudaea sp. TaxID=2136325 RepID=UPI0039E2EF4C
MPRPRPLSAALSALLLSAYVHADATDAADQTSTQLPGVTVTASPLAQPGAELIQPSTVLAGPDLDDRRANTIGETINQIPGVQSSYFGAGVGRPIIRGLEGSRVQVLEGGISSLDLSGASNDHAVTIDPFLADQVEVLKGPSTLLYGSGAIGGVVNVVDGRIPESPIDGVHGRAQLNGSTASDERNGVARIDAGNGEFAVHADYVRHLSDDYDIPDGGTLRNSDVSTRSSALGAGYTGSSAFAGASVSQYETHYGIPVGPSDEPVDPDEEITRIDMKQTRVDLKAGLLQPTSWLDRVTLRYGHNDYQHVEHAVDEEEGTLFKNKGYELRLEAVLARLGAWRGSFGIQYGDRDFSAAGEETIVPNTKIKETGIFLVEEAKYDPFELQLGARYDDNKLNPVTGDNVKFQALSLSGGAKWEFTNHWDLNLNLDRAQRAPDEEALFVYGAHDATGSFEIGDPNLKKETANQIDLALHYHSDDVHASIGAYVNRFDDFIYLAETGETDPEEGLPIRAWSQHNAKFHGLEGEVKFKLSQGPWGRFDLRIFADTVRASLTDGGGNLPRIAPGRLGATLMWEDQGWRASLGAVGYARQDDVAQFETPTAGFTLVNAHLSRQFTAGAAAWELFLDGQNLGNQEARMATSFLKDRAPLPGRSLVFGIRNYF